MQPNSQHERKPVLLVAAESIATESGVNETVADVLRSHALEHYGEALRQYMSIRLGNLTSATRGMKLLRERLQDLTREELAAEPGARAKLFRLAREITGELQPGSVRGASDAARLCWQPPAGANVSYSQRLESLRENLSPYHAELLELRYARELNHEEVAYVVESSLEDVITELEVGAAEARRLLGDNPPSQLGGLRGALQEAFALSQADSGDSKEQRARRPAIPTGTVIGERYALESRVGEGSFGDVYRASDLDVPGHVVALKLLHNPANSPKNRKSALKELRLIASVFHPSVVDFKDHGWFRGRLWFVMPWYEGQTLEERIQEKPLTRAEAVTIFAPLAHALSTIHEAGIRHQDIKPDNIFLARIGDPGKSGTGILPILIDLGVAAKEAEMVVAGTPLYFAPEVAAQYACKPTGEISRKADVFSLALALRNALEPHTQERVPGTAVEAFIAHRADHPPAPPESKELAFLLPHFRRWLALDPKKRPSAETFARELEVLTLPEQRRERRRATARWALPLALGCSMAIGGVTHVYLQERVKSAEARTLAKHTRQDLDQESALRQKLEVASAALREEYAQSLSTRDQLENRLETHDLRVQRLREERDRARREQHNLSGELERTQKTLSLRERSLTQVRDKLAAQQEEPAVLQGEVDFAASREHERNRELEGTRSQLELAEGELEESRGRSSELRAELKDARTVGATEQLTIERLKRALSGAERRYSAAQREVEELRRQVLARESVEDIQGSTEGAPSVAKGDTGG